MIAVLGDHVERVATWNPGKVEPTEFDYIDLSSVDQKRKAVTSAARTRSDSAPSRARQLVRDGDILVSTVRPNLNAVAQVTADLDGATASTGFTVLRPKPSLDGRYLFQWVRSPQFVGDMVRKATGASYPAVSDRIVKTSELPLPPIEEQRRIAAILDQADTLRAKRRDALAHLDDLAQSIFIDMFGDPIDNQCGWLMTTLGQLGTWRSGGTPPRSRTDYYGGSIPWFSSGELGPRYVSESLERITGQALTETSAKAVPDGSLLVGMYDTAALKCSITTRPAACNQAIAFTGLDESVASAVYVHTALLIGKERYKLQQRGIRQKNLNLSIVRRLPIALPPRDIQERFDSAIRDLDALQERADGFVDSADALFDALQYRAFAGRL